MHSLLKSPFHDAYDKGCCMEQKWYVYKLVSSTNGPPLTGSIMLSFLHKSMPFSFTLHSWHVWWPHCGGQVGVCSCLQECYTVAGGKMLPTFQSLGSSVRVSDETVHTLLTSLKHEFDTHSLCLSQKQHEIPWFLSFSHVWVEVVWPRLMALYSAHCLHVALQVNNSLATVTHVCMYSCREGALKSILLGFSGNEANSNPSYAALTLQCIYTLWICWCT